MTSVDLSKVAKRATATGEVLYRLNDFHEAAMADSWMYSREVTANMAPGEWARKAGAEFLKEIGRQETTADGRSFLTEEGRNGGSYGSELVCLRYAAYLSVEFEVEVYRVFQAHRRAQASQAPSAPALTAGGLVILEGIFARTGGVDARAAMSLRDAAARIAAGGRHLLPTATERDWQVSEAAEELGYRKQMRDRSLATRLGAHIVRHYYLETGARPKRSLRLIDGSQRGVNTYPQSYFERMAELIHGFFSQEF